VFSYKLLQESTEGATGSLLLARSLFALVLVSRGERAGSRGRKLTFALLGTGIASVSVPLYLSEVSPAPIRGALVNSYVWVQCECPAQPQQLPIDLSLTPSPNAAPQRWEACLPTLPSTAFKERLVPLSGAFLYVWSPRYLEKHLTDDFRPRAQNPIRSRPPLRLLLASISSYLIESPTDWSSTLRPRCHLALRMDPARVSSLVSFRPRPTPARSLVANLVFRL
jgi:hypothetical protein